jgi:hypothetical protein
MNKCYKIEKKKELVDDEVKNFIEISIDEYFRYLLFKNFYTERVCLEYENENKFLEYECFVLMNDPDCEINAERYFVIDLLGLMEKINPPFKLRLYLTQTCKIWNQFNLTDIQLLNTSEADVDDCRFIKGNCFQVGTNNSIDPDKMDQKYLDIMKIKDQFDLKFSILK